MQCSVVAWRRKHLVCGPDSEDSDSRTFSHQVYVGTVTGHPSRPSLEISSPYAATLRVLSLSFERPSCVLMC